MLGARMLQAAAGARTFTPADLFEASERGVWYDPSDLATLWQDTAGTTAVTAVGQSVARIDDKSGNGNHATQSTGSKRPTLQQDGNGNYYLDFAGGQVLSAGSSAALAPQTDSWMSVCGAKFDDGSSSKSLYARALANALSGRYSNHRTGAGVLAAFYDPDGLDGEADVIAGAADADTTIRVVTALIDRIAGTGRERVNNVSFGAEDAFIPNSATDQLPTLRFLIGAFGDFSDSGEISYLDGRIYGLVLRFTSSASESADTERWMAHKCGITL